MVGFVSIRPERQLQVSHEQRVRLLAGGRASYEECPRLLTGHVLALGDSSSELLTERTVPRNEKAIHQLSGVLFHASCGSVKWCPLPIRRVISPTSNRSHIAPCSNHSAGNRSPRPSIS